MPSIPESLVATRRVDLRSLVHSMDALIPELEDRGRGPTGNFPPVRSLGYVEIDRGEDDLRPLIALFLSALLDVVTDDDYESGIITYGEPISVGLLLDRLDWCVTTDPQAGPRFPNWRQQDDQQRFEAVTDFVTSTLRDYHLRLLEVAETEEAIPEASGLPSYEEPISDLRLFGRLLVVNDAEIEITRENAGDIRGWLFDVMCFQGSKLTESQQAHLYEALQRTDSLCPVSMAKWIP